MKYIVVKSTIELTVYANFCPSTTWRPYKKSTKKKKLLQKSPTADELYINSFLLVFSFKHIR